PDLVNATLDLLIDGASGVWHLANQGLLSWYGLATLAASKAGMATTALVRSGDSSTGLTALSSERGLILPPLEGAVQRFVHERAFV
ncbi:MAG TPA: hypothetical protein VFX01_08230, partial [Methylophilaceae bacterium]|nr:hypothetical protein [Methylophilaceae bacterium]